MRDFYAGDDRDEYMEVLARIPSFPMLRAEVPIAKISRITGKPVPLRKDCVDEFFSPADRSIDTDKLQLDLADESREDLLELLKNLDDNFAVTLLKLIDAKGISEVECYKKACVSKQTWYKIMNEKGYKPSRNTAIAFAIALELSLDETNALLSTVGFTWSRSSKADIIIEFFIGSGIYDIMQINDALFEFDQPLLSV